MIIPKISKYYVEELLNGAPCGYAIITKDLYSPEEAVEYYIETVPALITIPIDDRITFFVEDLNLKIKYHIKATYGWSCKQICMPEELK